MWPKYQKKKTKLAAVSFTKKLSKQDKKITKIDETNQNIGLLKFRF